MDSIDGIAFNPPPNRYALLDGPSVRRQFFEVFDDVCPEELDNPNISIMHTGENHLNCWKSRYVYRAGPPIDEDNWLRFGLVVKKGFTFDDDVS